ncbi:hypothetical protein GCM10022410_17130 [Amphibacillus indicireducens]|uniref:Uncharacterized protein n=1 Tax=Amphibacillus indicireducens TaxID=1076330 RepID=A0ABP7VQ79_9BACI
MELQLDYAILVDKLDLKPLYYRIERFLIEKNYLMTKKDKIRQLSLYTIHSSSPKLKKINKKGGQAR